MSTYQALYRKYRPKTFDEVVGQRAITDTLKNQLLSGKLSHGYLFTGSHGTGKTTCAKILSKAVNCQNPQDGNPCNQCAACRGIDAGSVLDVLEIDAASNNGVDHVRALRDDAIYSPADVNKRVYIIDEVHMLSTSAFNALLKIIEEPPAHLLFILATTELHKVPATIVSRCQRFSFRRIVPEDIMGRLQYIAYQEGMELSDDGARLLARLADGALRDALSLLDQCASATTGTIDAEAIYGVLGLAGDKNAAALMQAIGAQDAKAALSLFHQLYQAGKDIAAVLDELCSLARDLLLLKTAPAVAETMLSGVCTQGELAQLSGTLSAGELLRITSILQETASGFSKSANRRIDAELCLMQLCTPALSNDLSALLARITRLEERLATGAFVAAPALSAVSSLPAPQAAPSQSPPKEAEPEPGYSEAPSLEPEPAAPALELPATFWPEFVAKLRSELPQPDAGLFSPTDGPVSCRMEGSTLLLVTRDAFVKRRIDKPELVQLAAQKASALLGQPIPVKVTMDDPRLINGVDPFDALLDFAQAHPNISVR